MSTDTGAVTVALHDRQAELSAISNGARGAARGTGCVLLVEGPAGIGKTALLRAGRQIAGETGLSVLTARGAELERDFGFGVVRQLFVATVDASEAVENALAGPARLAAQPLGIGAQGAAGSSLGGPDAAYAMLNALHALTANLARRAPLMLLVDDAHWVDPASLRFLAYLARRLESLPVMLLVAARPVGEPGGASVAPPLIECGATVLRPGPLSELAAGRLVRAAVPDASDDVCRACHAASGGNPFFLRELSTALRAVGPTDSAGVLGIVPQGVVAAVRSRIDRLPSSAQKLARGLAIFGDGSPLRHAAQAVGLDDHAAVSAADALVAAGILTPDAPLRFVHPLTRTAVYEELPRGERAAAHERAARVLAAEDAPAERVAAHLLAIEPRRQPWVCERLRAAAREGTRRGAPEAAVTYLRRALEEPPPAVARSELLLELGEAEALSLEPVPAADHLRRGIDGIRDPARRLHAALMLSAVLGIDDRALEAVEVLERALADAPDVDPKLLGRIEGHLVNVARFDLATRRSAAARATRVRRRAEADQAHSGVELTAAAAEEAMAGDSAERTAELAERAIERLAAEGTFLGDYTVYTAARCLLVADRLEQAGRVLDEALRNAREHGAVVSAAGALAFRSDARYRAGALKQAADDAQASLQSYRQGWRTGLPATAAILAKVLVEQGHLDAAAKAVQSGGLTEPPGSTGTSYAMTMLLHARGGLRLAQGDTTGALEDLLEVGRRQEIMGEPNPALMDWRSLAALALARLDRRSEALTLAEEEVTLARRFGAPRALGLALRAIGLVEGGERRINRLREAETTLAKSPARLAHAHALTDLGAAMRRGGTRDAAREALTTALDQAHACGASALEARALRELRSTGARPRRSPTRGPNALTASERRAAELASQGLSNREIADRLFVTVRTVEFHLSGAFRKLGIKSRKQLTGELAGKAEDA